MPTIARSENAVAVIRFRVNPETPGGRPAVRATAGLTDPRRTSDILDRDRPNRQGPASSRRRSLVANPLW